MRTWEQFYIEHCLKFTKPWDKKSGWCVWHSCFDYLDGCRSDFWILSETKN